MTDTCVILVGGGSRGLGKAIADQYINRGINTHLLHRNKYSDTVNIVFNYFYDIDHDKEGKNLNKLLVEITKTEKNKKIVIYILPGGSLGAVMEKADYRDIKRVFEHNIIVPMMVAKFAREAYFNKDKNVYQLFFFSSAVTRNYNSTPYYVAAKSALEAFYKSYVKEMKYYVPCYLIRLGHVDIEHKYLHEWSENNHEDFKEYLRSNVPSNHFTQVSEIADFCMNAHNSRGMYDNMICDLTGGHAWN